MNAGEDVGGKKNSYTLLEGTLIRTAFRENSMDSPQIKTEGNKQK